MLSSGGWVKTAFFIYLQRNKESGDERSAPPVLLFPSRFFSSVWGFSPFAFFDVPPPGPTGP